MTQSYANPGGTGNRASLVSVTTTAVLGGSSGPVTDLVNGTIVNSFWWNSGQTGREVVFGFAGTGFTRCITEAKWYQNSASTHGDWKWQGSNNGTTWTDIGGMFTLGGSTVQTITTLSGNVNFWQFYRMLQVSGSTSSSPFLQEIEFSTDDGGGVAAVPDARLAQAAVEQWAVLDPAGQMSQLAVEQWASVENVNWFSARHV